MTGKDNDRTPVLPWSFNNDHALIEDADGNAVLTNISEDVGPFIVETCNTHASLKSTVDRLREALTRIANHHSDVEPYDADHDCWDHIANLVLIARRALDDNKARAALTASAAPSTDV